MDILAVQERGDSCGCLGVTLYCGPVVVRLRAQPVLLFVTRYGYRSTKERLPGWHFGQNQLVLQGLAFLVDLIEEFLNRSSSAKVTMSWIES